jgi:hypothetical protein
MQFFAPWNEDVQFHRRVSMPASKHQLAASAYHIRPVDMRKLLLAATHFRDRCLITQNRHPNGEKHVKSTPKEANATG